ncbi:MAG: hypothetical protein Q9N68_04495 [Gammaproteobacteria bacterium]|nr:hypothetical protein [Gammaproteobacteria bacterium]
MNPSTTKVAQWHRHLNQWSESGLTQKAYCQQARITLANFSLWRRRLQPRVIHVSTQPTKTAVKARFQALQISPDSSTVPSRSHQPVHLCINGVSLSVPLDQLSQVLPILYASLGSKGC